MVETFMTKVEMEFNNLNRNERIYEMWDKIDYENGFIYILLNTDNEEIAQLFMTLLDDYTKLKSVPENLNTFFYGNFQRPNPIYK